MKIDMDSDGVQNLVTDNNISGSGEIMRIQFTSKAGMATLIFMGIFSSEAYAYLDPGTGSYVFQLLIAFVIGGLYAVKLFWAKIVSFFKNLFPNKND
jgi:hypothetical protein